jgi:hypothetical protein
MTKKFRDESEPAALRRLLTTRFTKIARTKRESMRLVVGVVASLLFTSSLAMAEGSSAGYEYGGQFSRFDPVVAQYNRSGELFRIVGHCQSSCTLFLAIKNVCVESGASLLFHAGHDRARNITTAATNHLLNAYNAKLRNYLVSNGYTATLAFHTISGRDMVQKFGYRACPGRA